MAYGRVLGNTWKAPVLSKRQLKEGIEKESEKQMEWKGR